MAETEAVRLFTETTEEDVGKWVTHYLSFHEILLVGEGDFSFSTSLARSFCSGSNIVATSLDSYDAVIKKYKHAKSNLDILEKVGASLLFGVDATKMKLHTDLKMRKFDRIIYNFPHAGFHGKENDSRLIKKHRNLVHGFFGCASGMLRANGEIHVNHKTTVPFCHWNLAELASQNSLILIESAPFKREDYPGYNHKRGSGSRCDEPFPLGDCSTFKFIFCPTAKKVKKNLDLPFIKPQEITETPIYVPCEPNPFQFRHPLLNFSTCMNGIPVAPTNVPQQLNSIESRVPQSNFFPLPTFSVSIECLRIFEEYFRHVVETSGETDENVSYFLREALRLGYERYMAEDPGRNASGYINILEELHNFFRARQEWSRRMLVDLDYPRRSRGYFL